MNVIHTEQFAQTAAAHIIETGRKAIAERGEFRIALSGGNTPRIVFAEIAAQPDALSWDRVLVTFGDERCVPPDHAQSNYRMARESLLGVVPIPESNVLRMKGEILPAEAAAEYEAQLALRAGPSGESRFVHDLILLGLGDDGHTASLFPDTAALNETERNVVSNHVSKLNTDRITLTFPLINAAREVCFLVGDDSKRKVVDEVLSGTSAHPAGHVAPTDGQLVWLLGYK